MYMYMDRGRTWGEGRHTAERDPKLAKSFIAEFARLQEGCEHLPSFEDGVDVGFDVVCFSS